MQMDDTTLKILIFVPHIVQCSFLPVSSMTQIPHASMHHSSIACRTCAPSLEACAGILMRQQSKSVIDIQPGDMTMPEVSRGMGGHQRSQTEVQGTPGQVRYHE